MQKKSSNLKTEVKMVLRELNEKDLESLIKLYKQLDDSNDDFTAEDARKIWKTEIEGNKKIKYFGAVENGKVISTCYCLIIQNLTHLGSSIAFVENVVTDSEYRGQGLAVKSWKWQLSLPANITVTKLFCKVPALEKKPISFIKILASTANLKKLLS